ncbi:helix-turn-helix domain-containing protein [Mucilaginibacter sp.]
MKGIPVHALKDKSSIGLELKRFENGDLPREDQKALEAHRDDHYIFFVLKSGSGSLLIDFNRVCIKASNLYYVLPTQVHNRIQNKEVDGWFLAIDTALIPPECRNVFESNLLLQQPYLMSEIQLNQCHNLLALLYEKYNEDSSDPFYVPVVHALLRSFLAIAAGCYSGYSGMDLKVSRPAQLTRQFKNLLVAELRCVKSPAEYAAKLNVSESYLNESLKKMTGFPVSYWIHQEIIMEAKRLLYYSHLTVKEIAHALGYNDHSYFSRIFRKVTGISAIAFREQYRK